MPAVVRERRQRFVAHQPFAGNADIGFAGGQHRDDLFRTALIEHHPHPRIKRAKLFDHSRQAIARLGVRRRDMQLPRVVAAEDVRQATDVIGVV